MVAQGSGMFHRRFTGCLQSHKRLTADTFDQSFGQLFVGVFLDYLQIGLNDLKFERGTAAIQDEYIHIFFLRKLILFKNGISSIVLHKKAVITYDFVAENTTDCFCIMRHI
jgi:hypothetical protein